MFYRQLSNLSTPFYLIFRLVVGLVFSLHGAAKFGLIGTGSVSGFAGAFGLPLWLAYIASTIELVGGLLILLGLFSRVAAVLGSMQMLVALVMAHFPKGINPLSNGGEAAVLFFVAFLVIMAYGPGKIWAINQK